MQRTDLEYYRRRHAQELAQANKACDSAAAFVHSTLADAYAYKVQHLTRQEGNLAREQAEALDADRRRGASPWADRYWAGFPLLRN